MNKLEYLLISINSLVGLSITIEDAKNILGIVILILQGILILYNVIRKVYQRIKRGEYDLIDDDIKDCIDEIEELKRGGK